MKEPFKITPDNWKQEMDRSFHIILMVILDVCGAHKDQAMLIADQFTLALKNRIIEFYERETKNK